MIRFKDISIPKPCSVDYDTLPGDEVKRFCGSCEKHVYDFRGKNEVYLNEVFKQTGKVCGIYYEDQINTSNVYKPFGFQSFLNKLITFILFMKTLSVSADSDTKEMPVQISQSSFHADTIPAINAVIKGKKKAEKLKYLINIYIGDVLYKSDAPIYDNYIYLPASISDDQLIRVVVHKRRSWRNKLVIKPKDYQFRFGDADKVCIKIVYKRKLIMIRKKQRATMGLLRH